MSWFGKDYPDLACNVQILLRFGLECSDLAWYVSIRTEMSQFDLECTILTWNFNLPWNVYIWPRKSLFDRVCTYFLGMYSFNLECHDLIWTGPVWLRMSPFYLERSNLAWIISVWPGLSQFWPKLSRFDLVVPVHSSYYIFYLIFMSALKMCVGSWKTFIMQ